MRKATIYLLLCLFFIGSSAFSQSKSNIIDSLEKALTLNQSLRTLAPKNKFFKIDTTRVTTLNLLSSELLSKADFDRVESLLNEALAIANKTGFKIGQVNAYNNLGTLYRRKSEYPLALQNLEKALKIAKEIGYQMGIANIYTNIANVNNNQSNFPEAIKNHLEALKISESLNDRIGVSISYNNLGIISSKIGNDEDALKYHLAAFKIRKELNDKRGLSGSYNNFGILYYKAGNFQEALLNYFEVVKICQELGDRLGLANVYVNIGYIYCAIKDFDKALDYSYKSLVIQKTISNDFGAIQCYINIANTYKASKQFQLSKFYLDSAIRLSKQIGSKQLIRDSYKLLSEVDSSSLDWENAYFTYKTYTIYKDSIINQTNLEKIKQSQIQYELEKKDLTYQKLIALKAIQFEYLQKQAAAKTEKEKQRLSYEQQIKEQMLNFEYAKKISKVEAEHTQQLAWNEILAKENKLMNQNSKNEIIIRWLMILVLFAFVAFGIYYFKNYNSQKAANIIIAKQGEDLKSLIHELNHRVKNNFQTVASMLRLQSRTLDDKTLLAILMQTSNQFLSIANVHEKLYQLESFSGIPIKDFLHDIVSNISQQFEVEKEQFESNIIDYCELKVNMQTILPLVLIVNELVTNTFKHAFSSNVNIVVTIYISHIQGNNYQLIYRDNGPGLPLNFSQSTTFGHKMLKLFAEQLHGSIKFNNENGAVSTLTFQYV